MYLLRMLAGQRPLYKIIIDVHMWWSHVMLTCNVHTWCSHVVFTLGVHMWFTWFTSSNLLYMMCTYDVHMWNAHIMFMCETHKWCTHIEFTCDVHMWSSHMEFTCDLWHARHVIYRIWFTVYGVHMWFPLKSYTNIKIIYGKPHVVFRMWFPHMISACDFRTWSPHVI